MSSADDSSTAISCVFSKDWRTAICAASTAAQHILRNMKEFQTIGNKYFGDAWSEWIVASQKEALVGMPSTTMLATVMAAMGAIKR